MAATTLRPLVLLLAAYGARGHEHAPTPSPKPQDGRVRHIKHPSPGCSASRVDGELNCHPEAGGTQKACEARGCCWDAGYSDGHGIRGFCYPRAGGHGQCPYHKNSHINCHPEAGATEAACRARGCCWDPSDEKSKHAIWCYPMGPSKSGKKKIDLTKAAGAPTPAPTEKTWGKKGDKGPTEAMPTAPPNAQAALGDSVTRACTLLLVSASPSTVANAPGLWGLYTLQYETYDQSPVYRQHTFVCDPDKVQAAVKAASVPGSTASPNPKVDYSCTAAHFRGKTAVPHPRFLFYDGQAMRWTLSEALMSYKKDMFSRATEASAPDLVKAHGWVLAEGLDLKVFTTNNAGITVGCKDKAKGPNTHGRSKQIRRTKLSTADSGCIKWRKTAGCDPTGPREPEQDKSCTAQIAAKDSGFCECKSGMHHAVACGHEPFTCADACKVHFPIVLAQSGERVWTNQLARNLVAPAGDWFTSRTSHQWVVFDLGDAKRVRRVEFKLWGSDANPRHAMLQTADASHGPWAAVKKFVMGESLKVYTTHIDQTARYWRLYIVDNWGAKWGLGFNGIKFDDGTSVPHKKTDPCTVFTSRESCIYLSTTSSNLKMLLGGQHSCGWCSGTNSCHSGDPNKAEDIACDGVWSFNTLEGSTGDVCGEFTDCDACTDRVQCGWCLSSNSCKSNYCRHWTDRQCGGAKHLLHTRNTEKTLLRKTGEVIGGLVGASALLGIPTFVLFKRRRSYWMTRLNMKDADAQWDDAASQIVEIDAIPDAYQDQAADAGEARGLLAEAEG